MQCQSDPLAGVCRKGYMLMNVEPAFRTWPGLPRARRNHGKTTVGQVRKETLVQTPEASANTEAAQQDVVWVGLVQRICVSQDRAAFAQLFRHFAPRIKAFLIRSGADPALAEECAQEVMATLWHKAHLFDPSRASVATWIFTIARNRRIDALRKQRRPEPEELTWGPEAEPAPEDVLALQQESDKLRTALATLPDAQRELVERAYFGDLSHSEIASETGLPLGTIKSRIRLALDRLRHAMK